MQNKQKITDWSFKTLLFAFIVGGVWYLLRDKGESLSDVFRQIVRSLSPENILFWVFLLLLTALNWGLEAKKWQALLQNVEQVRFPQALQTVLSGMALGYVTPLGLGDWGIKLSTLQNQNRAKSVGAMVLGGGVQVFVAWFFGALALAYFMCYYRSNWFLWLVLGALVLGLCFGFWVMAQRVNLDEFIRKHPRLKPLHQYFELIQDYSSTQLTHIFVLTTFRYAVFVGQMVLLFYLFGVGLLFIEMTIGAIFVFFIKAIVPLLSFASDLGIREISALYYFNYFGVLPSAVVGASLSLWCINILLPMCIGGVLVWRFKFGKS